MITCFSLQPWAQWLFFLSLSNIEHETLACREQPSKTEVFEFAAWALSYSIKERCQSSSPSRWKGATEKHGGPLPSDLSKCAFTSVKGHTEEELSLTVVVFEVACISGVLLASPEYSFWKFSNYENYKSTFFFSLHCCEVMNRTFQICTLGKWNLNARKLGGGYKP